MFKLLWYLSNMSINSVSDKQHFRIHKDGDAGTSGNTESSQSSGFSKYPGPAKSPGPARYSRINRPKVLLIQPPIYDFALYDLYFKPYGLLRIGNWFRKCGYAVELLNALDWDEPETRRLIGPVKRKTDGTGKFFKQFVPYPAELEPIGRYFHRYGILQEVIRCRIREADPDIIAVTSGMTYWYKGVEEVLRLAREEAPESLLFAGGVYASLMPEHLQRLGGGKIDAVAHADDISEMTAVLERHGYPTEQEEANETAGKDVAEDGIPRHPLLIDGVWEEAGVVRLNDGCPLRCDYCASHILCPRFRSGSPELAFQWVESLVNTYGTRNFAFYDDALLVNKEHAFIPFLKLLLSHSETADNLSWYMPNAMHIRYLDQETADLMHQAGFREVRMGFESSSEAFHHAHDQKFSLTAFQEAVGMLKRAGFSADQLIVYILAGLPGQYAEEAEASIRYAAEAGVRISAAEYSPVPQTPMWEESCRISRLPLAEEPLYHNNSFQPMAWEGFTREDMERLKRLSRELNPGN